MQKDNLSVRELQENDFENIIDYFVLADNEFLLKLGVDTSKLPDRNEWRKLLAADFNKPNDKKNMYYLIWLINGQLVGHSNINKIIFAEEAYMHLHLWNSPTRKKGLGFNFIKMSLPIYFDSFKLKKIYSEPNAFNTAPNKTLEKSGFQFEKQYQTTPGWLNFHQPVNRWCITLQQYQSLYVS